MKTLACGVAVALLAGCGGSQPPIGAPGTTRQTALVTHAERGKSWMLPEAKNRNLLKSKSPSLNGNVGSNDVRLQQASKRALLYASLDTSIGIYTYPDGKAVGTIQTTYGPESVCNGNSGDIWVATSFRYAYEFKRGNEHPIETADTGTDAPITSCAVSPTDGKLALAAYSVGIFIFEKDRGSAKLYVPPFTPDSCAYDNHGNLFIDGIKSFGIAELPRGSKQFINIRLDRRGGTPAGGLLWDGKYMAVATAIRSQKLIYRFNVGGSSGTVAQVIHFKRQVKSTHFAIYENRIIGQGPGANFAGLWPYPEGGQLQSRLDIIGARSFAISAPP